MQPAGNFFLLRRLPEEAEVLEGFSSGSHLCLTGSESWQLQRPPGPELPVSLPGCGPSLTELRAREALMENVGRNLGCELAPVKL